MLTGNSVRFTNSSSSNQQVSGSSSSNWPSSSWGYSSHISHLWLEDDDNNDDEENPFGKSMERNERDCTIFAIDCSESMLSTEAKTNDENASIFDNVCNAISKALKRKIIQSTDSQVCILLFNTRETKNGMNFSNIYIFSELDSVSAKLIRSIRDLPEFALSNFDENIGGLGKGKECDFRELLWVIQTVFSDVDIQGSKFGVKRTYFFTNNDNPYRTDDRATFAKSLDMSNAGIETNVFPISSPNSVNQNGFNLRSFYSRICSLSPDEFRSNADLLSACPQLEDLEISLRAKELKKRSLVSCPLQIGKNFAIAIKMFSTVRRATKDAAKHLDARTNQPLTSNTRWLCYDTGDLLDANMNIRTYMEYGPAKERVYFNKEEMKQLKMFGDPSLVLMGFKPLTRLKPYYQLKPAYFAYPNEQRIQGSNLCFNALIQAMTELKQFAVARFIFRKASGPQFVALVAQKEVVDESEGHQIEPPGLHVIFLPFADDIRKIPLKDGERERCDSEETEILIDKAKCVIEKMTVEGMNFPANPVLQKHYDALEALALDEDPTRIEFIDEIEMNEADFDQQAGEEIGSFLEELSNFTTIVNEAKEVRGGKRGKRRAAATDLNTTPKKARKRNKNSKPGDANDDASDLDWKSLADNDELKNLKVVDLKRYLSMNGLKMSGRKAELIERIKNHLQSS